MSPREIDLIERRERIHRAAFEQISEEKRLREERTAKLREARLAREAAEAAEAPKGKAKKVKKAASE